MGKKNHQHREIPALFKEAPHLQITEGWENKWGQPSAVLNSLGGIFWENILWMQGVWMQVSHASKTDDQSDQYNSDVFVVKCSGKQYA